MAGYHDVLTTKKSDGSPFYFPTTMIAAVLMIVVILVLLKQLSFATAKDRRTVAIILVTSVFGSALVAVAVSWGRAHWLTTVLTGSCLGAILGLSALVISRMVSPK